MKTKSEKSKAKLQKKSSKIGVIAAYGGILMFIAAASAVWYSVMLYMPDFLSSRLQTNATVDNLSDSDTAVSPTEITEMQLNQRITEIVADMSVEEKVGQMFVLRADDSTEFYSTISQTKAGGVVLFARDFKNKSLDQVIDMIEQMQSASDGKMLIAVDEEGGTVVRVSSNPKLCSTKFKSPQDLYAEGGFERIKSDTEKKCTLLKSLGINVNLAPVADVCTNKNGFMYKRSFGKGANATAEYVSLVVNIMGENQVASCVKHFPGYGNSEADTHKGFDVNTKSLQELNECDLIPFRRAVESGADGIMITHTIINAIDSECPASLSPEVVKMIRQDMNFDGVIISDGLDMGAITNYSSDSGKICIMSVNAGIDLLCLPQNPVSDYCAVLNAVNSGEISQSRIDEAVLRIVKLKIKLGLYD